MDKILLLTLIIITALVMLEYTGFWDAYFKIKWDSLHEDIDKLIQDVDEFKRNCSEYEELRSDIENIHTEVDK